MSWDLVNGMLEPLTDQQAKSGKFMSDVEIIHDRERLAVVGKTIDQDSCCWVKRNNTVVKLSVTEQTSFVTKVYARPASTSSPTSVLLPDPPQPDQTLEATKHVETPPNSPRRSMSNDDDMPALNDTPKKNELKNMDALHAASDARAIQEIHMIAVDDKDDSDARAIQEMQMNAVDDKDDSDGDDDKDDSDGVDDKDDSDGDDTDDSDGDDDTDLVFARHDNDNDGDDTDLVFASHDNDNDSDTIRQIADSLPDWLGNDFVSNIDNQFPVVSLKDASSPQQVIGIFESNANSFHSVLNSLTKPAIDLFSNRIQQVHQQMTAVHEAALKKDRERFEKGLMELENRKKALRDQEKALRDKEKALRDKEAELNGKIAKAVENVGSLDKRERALEEREAAVCHLEEELTKKRQALEADQKQFQDAKNKIQKTFSENMKLMFGQDLLSN
jgi:hypothetical protein